MQQLIYFIQKYKYLLFFLLLQTIALALTINNYSFHRSKFLNSASAISGGIFEKKNNISSYLHLRSENEILAAENAKLKNILQKLQQTVDTVTTETVNDSILYFQKYMYVNGVVQKNEYHKAYNYLTLNRGEKEGITSEMAVVNQTGIVGVTDAVSNGYARVQSILNRNSKINARLKKSSYFGTLTWNTQDKQIVQLTDLPRQADLQVGDTIITGGYSAIFPEGIPIGTISDTKNREKENSVDIQLFNDMTNIREVYIIKNFHKKEIKNLEKNN